MSKKLLLRRPKCSTKQDTFDSPSPPKTSDPEVRSTSFKEEIQPEIDILDQEYLTCQSNDQFVLESTIPENIKVTSNQKEKPKGHNKCTVVSVWSIENGLLPTKKIDLQIPDRSREVHISAKTVRDVDRDNCLLQNLTQHGVYCHNLYEQTESSLPLSNKTVPRHIIIIQIAALLKRQLSDEMQKDVSCTILSVPKRQSSHFQAVPKYEIVLYENDQFKHRDSIKSYEISELLQEKLIRADNEGHYRHDEEESESDISPIDVSMMECHMTGKSHLRLCAHSISDIPNIKNIFPNLTVIDLSYNSFKTIPPEVFELSYLEELNVRNNPIQSIPDAISNLINLRILICSFTRLTMLPKSVFLCTNLQEMDVSYNKIACIPHISGPHKLKSLNLSGNPIRYFKKSFGCLCLDKLLLLETWTHPIFWTMGEFVPPVIDESWNFCDLCDQNLTEFSRSTLSFSRKFNHVLPIILSFCSSLCKNTLIPETL